MTMNEDKDVKNTLSILLCGVPVYSKTFTGIDAIKELTDFLKYTAIQVLPRINKVKHLDSRMSYFNIDLSKLGTYTVGREQGDENHFVVKFSLSLTEDSEELTRYDFDTITKYFNQLLWLI